MALGCRGGGSGGAGHCGGGKWRTLVSGVGVDVGGSGRGACEWGALAGRGCANQQPLTLVAEYIEPNHPAILLAPMV